MSFDTKDFEVKMSKTIDSLKQNLNTVRAGKANPDVLSRVSVDYYGTPTPLNQVSTISVPEARSIVIQPFDKSLISEIEKAILKSELGLNPSNDGKVIRISIPPLTAERRKELVKQIKKMGEDSKVQIRNQRRDAMDILKKMKAAKELSEDIIADCEAEVEKFISATMGKLEAIIAAKEKELLTV